MKKLIALLLAAIMVMAIFAGCSSKPAETPAGSEPSASTEVPAEEPPAESSSSTEAPSISLPTQEQVEQAASSLHQAASTVLDALFGSSSSAE